MKFKPTHKKGEVVVELGPHERKSRYLITEASRAVQLKRVLVPTDFSECSNKALAYALALARQFGAELTLLHVVTPYPPVPQMDPVDLESVQDAKRKLQKMCSGIADRVSVSVRLRTGDAHTEIIEAAKELSIDLIVIAPHSRSRLVQALVGSTAEKVVRHAGCPVLVVREHEHDFVELGTDAGVS